MGFFDKKKTKTLIVPLSLIFLLSSAVVLLVCRQAGGEGEDRLLTVERIYASREFAAERFGPARWLEDGSGYTTLEEGRSGGRDECPAGSRHLRGSHRSRCQTGE